MQLNAKWIFIPSSVLLLGAGAWALVQTPLQRQVEVETSSTPEPELWKQRLSMQDLDLRMRYYDRLQAELGRSAQTRAMVEEWARGTDELAWTAKLLLRESPPLAPQAPSLAPQAQNPRLPAFDELERRLQELEQTFGDLDRRFGAWRMPEIFEQDWSSLMPRWSQNSAESEQVRVQMGPDGVEVEIKSHKNGQEETKKYQASTIEELLEQHPELKKHLPQVRVPSQVRVDKPALRSPARMELPTDVLGIYSQKVDPEQAQKLGLPPEQGLAIESVKPGTIAQVLGLRRGDVLLELNGEAVYAVEDVRRILKERAGDAPLQVVIIPEGSTERRNLRWTPAEPEPESSSGSAPRPLRRVSIQHF